MTAANPSWVPAEVVEVRRSEGPDPTQRVHVVVLQESEGSRQLPIYVGAHEATALACTLEALEMPRPMTYQLAASLTAAAGSRIIDVRITRFTPPTFYAVVRIGGSAGTNEVDARPSDALNLALVADAPILVDAGIFEHPGPVRHPMWRTAWRDYPAGAPDIATEVRHWQQQLVALEEPPDQEQPQQR